VRLMAGGPFKQDWEARKRAALRQAEECERLARATANGLVPDSVDPGGVPVCFRLSFCLPGVCVVSSGWCANRTAGERQESSPPSRAW